MELSCKTDRRGERIAIITNNLIQLNIYIKLGIKIILIYFKPIFNCLAICVEYLIGINK